MQVSTLNPKCVTVGELYGEINSTTMEWKDGLLSHIYRKYAKNSRGVIRGVRRKQSNGSSPNPPNTPGLSRASSAKSIGATSVSAISIEDNSEGEIGYLTRSLQKRLVSSLTGWQTVRLAD